MFVWTVLYNIFIFVGSIYSVMVGFRGLFNLFLPQFFEMRCADWKWICIYLAIRIYGLFFENVYKSIKKKEIAKARGTSILGEVRNVEIARVTQQLLFSKSHDFLVVFALAHSNINQIA